MTFRSKVFALVARIPRGRVMTYAAVARAIGHPRAARAVGTALGTNRDLRRVPCHRVVRADGSIGGYAFGAPNKRKILQREGIRLQQGRVMNLSTTLWRPD